MSKIDEKSEILSGLLHLTYYAQFSKNLNDGINDVISRAIRPRMDVIPPAHYIKTIIKIINSDVNLGGFAPSVEGRSDKEVRDYLVGLLAAIQETFDKALLSGHLVSYEGIWSPYGVPLIKEHFKLGSILPGDGGNVCVWVYCDAEKQRSPQELVESELLFIFSNKILNDIVERGVSSDLCASVLAEKIINSTRVEDFFRLEELLRGVLSGDNDEVVGAVYREFRLKNVSLWKFFELVLGKVICNLGGLCCTNGLAGPGSRRLTE